MKTITKLKAKSFIGGIISIYSNNEPLALRIIPTGWNSPQTYHVLREFGDYEDTEYLGQFNGKQIEEMYGIKIDPTDLDIYEKTKSIRNDQDLGGSLRKTMLKYRIETEI